MGCPTFSDPLVNNTSKSSPALIKPATFACASSPQKPNSSEALKEEIKSEVEKEEDFKPNELAYTAMTHPPTVNYINYMGPTSRMSAQEMAWLNSTANASAGWMQQYNPYSPYAGAAFYATGPAPPAYYPSTTSATGNPYDFQSPQLN
uniref:Uncharacterized protein n=1 Tax=Ditylenchus dipsaci TaxID=166011 RepID=A0A915E545_9BILA